MGTPLDPFDPTPIGPGLTAIPKTPTPWDDLEDGQHAVTTDGTVWQRRAGLWHMDPWWQGTDADEIQQVCADPDEWAYDMGFTRKQVEEVRGELTPITLPAVSGTGYPHSDERCRQESVEAAGFRAACVEFARLGIALGLPDTGLSFAEVVDAAIEASGGGAV